MKDYEVRRIAEEIVMILLDDDRVRRLMERKEQESGLVNTSKAAEILGVSKYTVREIAPYIGGTKKGSDRRQHWYFDRVTLVDNYKRYINSRYE